MFCRNCGREINEKMRFCPHCGFHIDNIENKNNVYYQEKEVKKEIINNQMNLVERIIVILIILSIITAIVPYFQIMAIISLCVAFVCMVAMIILYIKDKCQKNILFIAIAIGSIILNIASIVLYQVLI